MSKSIKSVSGRGTESKDTGINFFKTSQTINPCLIQSGIPQKRAGKKNFDCVFINFEDFSRLINFKRNKNENFADLSCFVADFIKTITLGKIDLEKFE